MTSKTLMLVLLLCVGILSSLGCQSKDADSPRYLAEKKIVSLFDLIKVLPGAPGQKARSSALSHYMMGNIYDNQNLIKEAIEEYKKALRYDPDAFLIHLHLGADYVKLAMAEKA